MIDRIKIKNLHLDKIREDSFKAGIFDWETVGILFGNIYNDYIDVTDLVSLGSKLMGPEVSIRPFYRLWLKWNDFYKRFIFDKKEGKLIKELESSGKRWLGCYHSHPKKCQIFKNCQKQEPSISCFSLSEIAPIVEAGNLISVIYCNSLDSFVFGIYHKTGENSYKFERVKTQH